MIDRAVAWPSMALLTDWSYLFSRQSSWRAGQRLMARPELCRSGVALCTSTSTMVLDCQDQGPFVGSHAGRRPRRCVRHTKKSGTPHGRLVVKGTTCECTAPLWHTIYALCSSFGHEEEEEEERRRRKSKIKFSHLAGSRPNDPKAQFPCRGVRDPLCPRQMERMKLIL